MFQRSLCFQLIFNVVSTETKSDITVYIIYTYNYMCYI